MTRDSCRECAIGRASGVGQGQFCPFIDRQYQPGDVLYHQGESAGYVWFIKSGSVELRSERSDERKHTGSFVGLESLVRDRYDTTAQVTTETTLCGATRAGFADWLGPTSQRTCAILSDLLRVEGPRSPSVKPEELSTGPAEPPSIDD